MCRRDVPNCTREVARCAEGTSQIAPVRLPDVQKGRPKLHIGAVSSLQALFSYVQFGTSLLHINITLCSVPYACWASPKRAASVCSLVSVFILDPSTNRT